MGRHHGHTQLTPELLRRIEYYVNNSDEVSIAWIAAKFRVRESTVSQLKRRNNEEKKTNTQAED